MKEKNYKVILLGNSGVGKTSIVNYILNGKSKTNNSSTVAASVCTKKLIYNKNPLAITLWDTAGQERFRSIVKLYYKKTDVCICVFDISRHDTFRGLQFWIDDYFDNVPINSNLIFVANKCDLPHTSWNIKISEIEKMSIKYNSECIYVNCIDGVGISDIIEQICKLVNQEKKIDKDDNNNIILNKSWKIYNYC